MSLLFRTLIILLCLCSWAQAEQTIPPLKHRVTDLTNTLDATQRQTIEQQLTQLEKQKGAQLAILIVPTTQPETIEQYSIRVAEAWALGRDKIDDGVLLLIAKDDRTMRIEVGYGLEGAITDATSKRIIAEIITPYFKQGNFYEGLLQGANSLIQVINGEPLPPPSKQHKSEQNDSAIEQLFGSVVAASFIGSLLSSLIGRLPAALVIGTGIAIVGLLFGLSFFFSLLAALLSFILVLAGITVGGSGGSGSSRSGGFSGGGGGFGGGGASGRW